MSDRDSSLWEIREALSIVPLHGPVLTLHALGGPLLTLKALVIGHPRGTDPAVAPLFNGATCRQHN